mmetsp:Transcript_3593/g.4008  ORF Transcript_3593/g.4008 Transcript_3593/m.4008 type:complete len:410 (+) Transcript_3593:180-1409(+)
MIPSAWVYSSRNYDCFQNSQPVLKPASSLFFTFSPTLQPSGNILLGPQNLIPENTTQSPRYPIWQPSLWRGTVTVSPTWNYRVALSQLQSKPTIPLRDSVFENDQATKISDDSEAKRQSQKNFETELDLHEDPRNMIESMRTNFIKHHGDVRQHQERVKEKLVSIEQVLDKKRTRNSVAVSKRMNFHSGTWFEDSIRADGRTTEKKEGMRKIFRCETKTIRSRETYCTERQNRRRKCMFQGCLKVAQRDYIFCTAHGGGKRCRYTNCTKSARGSTKFCISHGGGRRCIFTGCTKGARDANFCSAHGGGKRCKKVGCSKGALGTTQYCNSHGGGDRCTYSNCHKLARRKTKLCSSHGGGLRCIFPNCKLASVGKLQLCIGHGGGYRCKLSQCNKSVRSKESLCRLHRIRP